MGLKAWKNSLFDGYVVETHNFMTVVLITPDTNTSSMQQDNVFVQLHCSIQYRVLKENADDAFYELQNPREQIQSYVFDGK